MTPLAIVGIDLGKNWFHLVGLDEGGRDHSPQEIESGAAR